jgi:acyl carrier protein
MSVAPGREIARMTFLEARQTVLQALQGATNVFNEPKISARLNDPTVDFTFVELELDSLATIECCMVLEDKLRLEFDPADLVIHDSINKLAEHIVQRTAAA